MLYAAPGQCGRYASISLESMSKYRVMINGENFLLNYDGQPQKLGFYVSRIVDAGSPEEAEYAAVDLVRSDSWLKSNVLNEIEDPPMLYADEIEEIVEFDSERDVNTGFAWYTDAEA
ncbi:MAG TPA: hypothetical protein VF553_02530 [Pyrinomonadaceae bacterium]|jgi:hypothetical protein